VNNNTRIVKWFTFLQEFELEIEHVKRSSNELADALEITGRDARSGGPNEDRDNLLVRCPR